MVFLAGDSMKVVGCISVCMTGHTYLFVRYTCHYYTRDHTQPVLLSTGAIHDPCYYPPQSIAVITWLRLQTCRTQFGKQVRW